MLAVAWDKPFDDDGWSFEAKYDGVRAVVTIDDSSVRITSRTGNDMTGSYPELQALSGTGDGTVLDGEIIAFDDDGVPSFERLQSRMHRTGPSSVPISFIPFDLLALRGESIIARPLEHRTGLLGQLDLEGPVKPSAIVAGTGTALFAATLENGFEGIVAKRYGSPYRPGERSPHWRKIPHILRTRGVVGGFTVSERTRAGGFSSLLLGMWDGEALRFIGAVGTGFDFASAVAIRGALDQMAADESPFAADPAIPEATFVHPHLVAEIAFKQWTSAGRLRAPSFKGFSDRSHEDVTWASEGSS